MYLQLLQHKQANTDKERSYVMRSFA